MQPEQKISQNSWVAWTSQSQGFTKEKSGQVLRVVPAGKTGMEVFMDGTLDPKCYRHDFGGGFPRNHESYLIVVKVKPNHKPTVYWPRVSQLKPLENQSALSG